METSLRLRFHDAPTGRPLAVAVTAYDAGDNGLTIVAIEPNRGFHLRSGFDYEEGRSTIAVIDAWRIRGRAGMPEFRLIDSQLSVDCEALRRSCLYDHVGRFLDFASSEGAAVTVDGVDRAVADLCPSLRRNPA